MHAQISAILYVYSDPAYPLRVQLEGSFKGSLNKQQIDYNQAISREHTSTEYVFGNIVNYFAFLEKT